MIHRFVGFEEENKLYIEHFSLNSIFWLPGRNKVRFLTPKWDVKGVLWKLLSNEHGSPIFSFQKWILHKILHKIWKNWDSLPLRFQITSIYCLAQINLPLIEMLRFFRRNRNFFPQIRFFVIKYVYFIMSELQ